jgi:hypothetical protein
MASLTRQLEELEQATSVVGRYVDLCLILRREKTKETLLWAGGRWDRIDQRFIDAEPESGQIIDLVESQVPFTRWFAGWLSDYRDGKPRDTSLVLNEGGRRGGYERVAGADFQGRPHQAGAVLRIFEGDGGPIYWFCDS